MKNQSKNYFLFPIAILVLFNSIALSQSLEISGGMIHNRFFDYGNKDFHVWSTYESGGGYSIRLSVDDVKFDQLGIRFTLALENYKGKSSTGYGGLGGSNSMTVNLEKSILSATIYPLVINIKSLIDLDFGIETSLSFREKFTGKLYSRLGPDVTERNLKDEYNSVSSRFNMGLRARLAYDFKLTEDLVFSPQYSFYLGFTNEIDDFFTKTKAMKHFFGIGIERKLN